MIQTRHLDDGSRPFFEPEPPPAERNPYRLSAEQLRNGSLRLFSTLVARLMEAENLDRRAASHLVAEKRPALYDHVLEILNQ